MPTQTIPSLLDMLRVLKAATENGSLAWQKTVEEGTFRALLRPGYVRVSWAPEDQFHALSVFDGGGTLLEEYSPQSQEEFRALQELHQEVRKRVLNLETKLLGMYDHLKHLAGES